MVIVTFFVARILERNWKSSKEAAEVRGVAENIKVFGQENFVNALRASMKLLKWENLLLKILTISCGIRGGRERW